MNKDIACFDISLSKSGSDTLSERQRAINCEAVEVKAMLYRPFFLENQFSLVLHQNAPKSAGGGSFQSKMLEIWELSFLWPPSILILPDITTLEANSDVHVSSNHS